MAGLIEFVVYGGIGYGTVIMMMSMAFRSPLSYGLDGSAQRVYLIIPGIACIFLLSSFGFDNANEKGIPEIVLWEGSTSTTEIKDITEVAGSGEDATTTRITGSVTILDNEEVSIQLHDPVWAVFHMVLGVMMCVYLLTTVLALLTRI